MNSDYLAIRILLMVIYVAIWVIIVKKKSKSLWESIIGADKVLQISELVVLVGIVGYILMIPADAFWGIEASEKLWFGINAIVMTALGVSGYLKKQSKNDQ